MSEHEGRIRHRHHWRWDFPACQECGGSLTCAVCGGETRIDRYIAEAEAENAALRTGLEKLIAIYEADIVAEHGELPGPWSQAAVDLAAARALLARPPSR